MNGLTRHFRLAEPVMMWPVFALLRRGPGDPTHRRVGDFHLRATRTPVGPALIKIIANGAQVSARAWGEGAEWSLDQLPWLLGAADDPRGFRPRLEHSPLIEAYRRYGHYRVGRTEARERAYWVTARAPPEPFRRRHRGASAARAAA